MMREEGEAKRQEKQEFLFTQNSSSIIRLTKYFYHLPPSTGLFSQGSAVGACYERVLMGVARLGNTYAGTRV